MQFPNHSLMKLPLKGAGIIPRRYQLNNVMCFWWINRTVPQSRVCVQGAAMGMAQAPYLRHSAHLNQPEPSSTISQGSWGGQDSSRSSYTRPRSWDGLLGKCPKPRYQRDTHLLLLQPQFCPCLTSCTGKPGGIQQGQIQPSNTRGVSSPLRSWPSHLTSHHRGSRAKTRLWK